LVANNFYNFFDPLPVNKVRFYTGQSKPSLGAQLDSASGLAAEHRSPIRRVCGLERFLSTLARFIASEK
jgi:hypothetical protein